jgi:2-polyprenyl-3-methyl-5-hydroxy-6-metoxy-1,4-benzoquinol methylase
MPLEGKRILDIGCGAGILSLALCRLGAEVVGLDATGNVIEIAKSARETLQPQLRSNANFVQGTVEEFVLEPENIGGKPILCEFCI